MGTGARSGPIVREHTAKKTPKTIKSRDYVPKNPNPKNPEITDVQA
jgi:hypothetical protein